MALDGTPGSGKTGRVKTVLAIVACGPRLEVALASPGAASTGLVALAGPAPRSDLVMAAVDLLLRSAGLERAALEGVAATRGPGSFTGIRVALATAQGLAAGLGIPAQGYSSLLAQAARVTSGECLAVQPARRGFVYAQRHACGGGRPEALEEPQVAPLTSLAHSPLPVVAPVGLELPDGTPLASAANTTAEALLALLATEPNPDASTLAPVYVEPPQVTRPERTAAPWPPSPKAT